MCGICGFAGASLNISDERLEAMNSTLQRRGPDSQGLFHSHGIGLAMRRLSIIDLEGGDQPVRSDDGRYVAVFNGEIYNYRELRQRLKDRGRRFRSHGDAEVIVNQFAEFGEKGLLELRGMYAIAIWDTLEQELWLFRDTLGIKPLFYAEVGDGIVFGSEIKAVLASGRVDRRMSLQALDAFLAYNYIPPPLSIYDGILKLEPGMGLRWKGGSLQAFPFARLIDTIASTPIDSVSLEEEIAESIRYHMVSDVPVSVFLSGGLDSSAIAVQMQAQQPIDAFSIRFDEPGSHLIDETPFARSLQALHGFRLHESVIALSAQDSLAEIVEAFDEPFADDSVFPTYEICRIAAQSMKVCVSGAGGDELFGGYNRYQGLALSCYLESRLPRSVRRGLAGVGSAVARLLGSHTRRGDLVRRFSRQLLQPPKSAYLGYVSSLPVGQRLSLYQGAVRTRIDAAATASLIARHMDEFPTGDPVGAAMYADTQTYLCEDVLALSDRLGMWHSLEVRVPLADRHLASKAFSLPSSDHVTCTQKKRAMRGSISGWLPKESFGRPKQGFESPTAAWFRGGLGDLLARELSTPPNLWAETMRTEAVAKLLESHRRGDADYAKILFASLMLLLWARKESEGIGAIVG